MIFHATVLIRAFFAMCSRSDSTHIHLSTLVSQNSLQAAEQRRIPVEETENFLMALASSVELGDLRDKVRVYSRLFH